MDECFRKSAGPGARISSPRMSRTMRLDILPDVSDLERSAPASNNGKPEKPLSLSAEELHSIFQNAYDATLITDYNGNILFDNIRAREFLFASSGSLAGVNIISLLSGADDSTISTIHETLAQERFIRISAWCHSISDSYFPSDIAVYRTENAQRLCFFIRDVTDRMRAEEAERAVERSKVMMESIGTVCHHLGQPGTVILNSLELLKSLPPEDEKTREELINLSLEAAERIESLLRELNELRTYKAEKYAQSDSIVAIG